MRITFLRHGQTRHNAEGRWQGHLEGELSDEGRRQAALVGERLQGRTFDRIVSSDLARARETAELAGLDATPDEAWRELDVGDWAGRTHTEIWESDRETMEAMRRGEPVRIGRTGESVDELNARVKRAFDALADDIGEDGSALVVTHGGAIWSLAASQWGLPFPNRRMTSVVNTSLTAFDHRFGAWRISVYNDSGHLGRGAGLAGRADGERLLTFVRHGETDANIKQIWQGQSDWGLNQRGADQARALAGWFGDPGQVVSSPLGRAFQTATALNGGDPQTHPGLMEMSMGEWEDLDLESIKAGWPELFERIYEKGADDPRGVTGESVDDLIQRVGTAVGELTARHDGDLTLVSHGSAIRAYVVSILGSGYQRFLATGLLPNTGVTEVVVDDRGGRLHSYGVAPHLDEAPPTR